MKELIILLTLTVQVITLGQELHLTLETSVELGLKNSSEIKISKYEVTKADAEISEVTSQMLPKLSLNGKYAYFSDVPPFSVSLPGIPQPITLQKTILNNYYLNASIEQPIFVGLKLFSLRKAAVQNKKSEILELENTKINKIVSIKKAFWNYYITLQMAKLMQDNLSLLKKHQTNTTYFLENGLVTKNDLLKINVELSSAEMKLLDAENNKKIAGRFFNKVIGIPLNSKVNLTVNNIDAKYKISSIEDLYNSAKKRRKELKILSTKLNALESIKNSAQAGYFPKIFAFGNFYYSNPNQRYQPVSNKFDDSWDVGVAFKWDVWNWSETSSKVEKAEQDILQLEETSISAEENIQLEVYKNYLNLKKAEKKIELSTLQVESAEENYRITDKKFNQQMVTATELLDAETALLNAKTNLLKSKIDYILAMVSLKKSVGKISVKNE